MPSDLLSQMAANGFAIVRDVLNRGAIDRFLGELTHPSPSPSLRTRGGVFAIRNLLEVVPAASALARSQSARALVDPILGASEIPVRAILSDKTPAANWLVPWHQDLTIAVCRRADVAGYGPWSVKSGVPDVHPPADVLDAMLAVRIHLDPCNETNGALRVLPGTHRCGRLAPEAIAGSPSRGPRRILGTSSPRTPRLAIGLTASARSVIAVGCLEEVTTWPANRKSGGPTRWSFPSIRLPRWEARTHRRRAGPTTPKFCSVCA